MKFICTGWKFFFHSHTVLNSISGSLTLVNLFLLIRRKIILNLEGNPTRKIFFHICWESNYGHTVGLVE